MTRLTKPVRRVLNVAERGKLLCVKITREGVYVRRQGERESGPGCYFLPWKGVYLYAADRTVRERKRERAAERKRKRELAKELSRAST